MIFHSLDQGNGSMVIIEEEEGSILFFDLGQAAYGKTTFKRYYSKMLGYLANNDHIPLNDQVRSIDIVISHLHKDHFKNLTSGFLETLIEETEVSLRSIWAPPVDVFLAAEDKAQIFDVSGNVRPLQEVNSDISEFFARLKEFSSAEDPSMQANVFNHFINSHREKLRIGESIEVTWLSPPATTTQEFQEALRGLSIKESDTFTPVSDAERHIQNLNDAKESLDSPSNFGIPYPYSLASLLLTPQETKESYDLYAIGSKEMNIFEDLNPTAHPHISGGKNHEIVNRMSVMLNISDKETGTTALLTGDATAETLTYVLSEHEEELGNVDLLHVPHHGSDNGYISPIFFSTLQADHAFIPHGSIEEYGHPHPETLADLILAGTAFVHQTTASNDFMYTDETKQVFSNKRSLGEENRSMIDKNIIILADDLAGGLTADEITAEYNLRDFDDIGVNRTLDDIFSDYNLEVSFGRYGREITIKKILQQLDLEADIGLKEAATALDSLSEDRTLLEVLEEKWPVIVSPIDLRLTDVANAIRMINDDERIEQIYRRNNILIERTEEKDKILETDEDIARHLIIFESIVTSDSDFLADHPPKDATLDQLKAFGKTNEDQIKRLRGSTIKNRMVLHDIYTNDESPIPEKTESDFKAGDLIGFRPKRPDLRSSFKKSTSHTRHYPIEMSSGFLSFANDYLDWVIRHHPNYPNKSSRQFIAERGVELVSAGIFSPAEIIRNIIRRNVRKIEIYNESGKDYSLPTSLHIPDGAAMDVFDRLLDDDEKDEEYHKLYEELYNRDNELSTDL